MFTFCTHVAADLRAYHRAQQQAAAGTDPSTASHAVPGAVSGIGVLPKCYRILYKKENVEKDQLLCVSVRLLLRVLAREQLRPADVARMPDYTVLPLSSTSGLIEVANGFVLSDLRPLKPLQPTTALTESPFVNPNVPIGCAAASAREDDYFYPFNAMSVRRWLLSISGKDAAPTRTRAHAAPTAPLDIVRYLNLCGAKSAAHFLLSARLFLLVNYIFMVCDRHSDNVMLNPEGLYFHIDFGRVFSEMTTSERMTGSYIRIDDAFERAVVECARLQSGRSRPAGRAPPLPPSTRPAACASRSDASCDDAALKEEFYRDVTDWFISVRHHSHMFFLLWSYGVRHKAIHQFASERELAAFMNYRFDRSASRESVRQHLSEDLEQSVGQSTTLDTIHNIAKFVKQLF
ncbi:phosphatidylinositol kinase [Strigomonas culicis]|uniref:Phosphatidylinositol kinase n=1 Tax=Strigomonas culicis TaxID=28005 RepID=S9UK96_9TRYP|nr:phosphatidylinositol kinase [Strigomonas culicis]|eukprot:EPY15081.1 phosphatidylinositol kinase [Strigomonas culicis]